MKIDNHSKKNAQIRFALPSVIKEIDEKATTKSKKTRKGEKKSKTSEKKSKKSKKSKSDKKSKSKKSKASQAEPQKYYVAKYNIVLGSNTLLKDFIIIATFE